MEGSASTSRSRLAGGGVKKATASVPAGGRRSGRLCSNAGSSPPATVASQRSAGRKARRGSVELWAERGPKESSSTYCSRMAARFAEYDQCGKELRMAREELRGAQSLANTASKKNRPELKRRITSLKAGIAKLEERRVEILEGSGLLKEKMVNDDRFAAMKSPGEEKVEVDDGESSGGEESEEGGEEGKVEEDVPVAATCGTTKSTQDSYIEPAQVALPLSESEEEDMEGEAGGLLRAIVMQESPAHLQNFSFGDDPCDDVVVKRKAKKQKTQESVQYVFVPFQQSGPAAKLVQAAGSPRLPDSVSVVERSQHGGYSKASEKAEDAIEVKPARPASREGQDGLKLGNSGAAGTPQGGGGRVRAPEKSYAAVCLGGGSPSAVGTTSAAGHSPVRGGSGRALGAKGGRSVCSGGGPPSTVCSAGAAGHSPVRGESVRAPVPAAVPVRTGKPGDGAVGGAGVRSEGQPQAQAVSSPMEEEQSATPATAKPSERTLLKPAVLQVPASPGHVRKGVSASCEHDGRSSVVDERSVCGSVSGVNAGSSSGMNGRSGVDDGSCGVSCGVNGGGVVPGSGSGSGPAAPPAVAAPRSYANVAAGGSGGSPSPSGPGGHLQQRLLEALRRGDRSIQVEGRGEVDLSFWIERHGLGAFREQNGEVVWSLPTPGQDNNRRNVVRLVWRGEDACPPRAKVVELLLQMEFRARDIFALIHPYGSSEFDVSFVRPEGLELFWSNYEVAKNEPGWRDFAVKAISRQNSVKKVTVLTRNESLSCYDIMTWLGRYGDVTDMPKKNLDEHGIWSGAWTFSVKLKRSGSTVAHIPSAAFLGRDRIQVFYQGQPKVCHRCGSPTHFSAACTVQVCALCGGVGHLAASCRQIRCHLCGVLGHPFSRCPSAFARAAAAPAGESCEVAPAGEGTSRDGGAPGLVTRKKGPAKLRREENRRRSRELESAQVTGVALAPAPVAGPVTTEALGENVLDEEIRRLSKEEGNMADPSDSSHYESVDEESEERPKKKDKGKKKGKKKRSKPSVKPCTTGQVQNGSLTAPPLIDLSNRYLVLDTISSPSLEGEGEGGVPREKEPLGGTGPCPVEALSSEGRARLGPDGHGDQMDQSESKKRCKSASARSSSSSSGDEGSKKKGKQK